MLPHSRCRGAHGTSEGVHRRLSGSAVQPVRRALLHRRLGAWRRTRAVGGALAALLFLTCLLAYIAGTDTPAQDTEARGDAINHRGHASTREAIDPSPPAMSGTAANATAAPSPSLTLTETSHRAHAPPATTTILPAPPTPSLAGTYRSGLNATHTPTASPLPALDVVLEEYREGEYLPEKPQVLPGLQIERRTFTPAELLARFGDTDIIYSFVNGSEANHAYRKVMSTQCSQKLRQLENESFWDGGRLPPALQRMVASNMPTCLPAYFKSVYADIPSTRDLVTTLMGHARPGIGDRETDELRHSLRSVEQHVRWHRGRVVMVSPGHHPTWVDGAKNFLAGVCGDARVQALRTSGTHLRVTTVHQDALMPYGMRLTVNSHAIEQHLWRVRNVTPVHVYMNDDYFVNRDVAITDLFNEYGGTIVRTEGLIAGGGVVGTAGGGWLRGVNGTETFNTHELDVLREDYLPDALVTMWERLRRVRARADPSALAPLSVAPLNEAVDVAHEYEPEPLPNVSIKSRWVRRYATHAPFVYCTNMLRFLETRYEREFAHNSLHHRSRKARDLFIPFVYNAFIMARPWQASPKFLPYLLELHRSRRETRVDAVPPTKIVLDNFDGCGPASLRGGFKASRCAFAIFNNNWTDNDRTIRRIRELNPLYFNINTLFNSTEVAEQLRRFMRDKYPTAVYLEAGSEGRGSAMDGLFGELMALPVVGVVSDEEGVCPLVRSLALAFAGHHRGVVRVGVEQHGGATLREARAALRHRVVSAMPAPACVYSERVSVGAAARGEDAADIARRAIGGAGAGVVLPSTCGGGAGLRVRGFVVDARTPGAPVRSAAALRDALAVPAQTLSLEDFRAVAVGPSAGDVVLVVSRADADAKAVHWVNGASESDLLVTYPLPVEAYENMSAEVRWSIP
ncbi:hypothetical protein LSCM1_05746 [Leishmania martiniquensis]|uniref:Stealth protein CR3 conserved region 3 domain-containing protein n=1 Tax=Leishmania martiniquensis TaxID=1580590 RepID=A0A836KPH8_9TRYP|nr:hypothetical protein LSCM1_05746 [Leishmania martiniquensis]